MSPPGLPPPLLLLLSQGILPVCDLRGWNKSAVVILAVLKEHKLLLV